MIYFIVQGPYNAAILKMITQFEALSNVRYCISTYKSPYIKQLQNSNIIYSSPLELPDNEIIRNIKERKGEGIYCQQIYSTFIGLYNLRKKFNIEPNSIVVKCRTDEYFNVQKLIQFLKNDRLLYNIDYVNHENSMSDHLFALNFDILYVVYYELMSIILGLKDDFYGVLKPLRSIEEVIFTYLKKHVHNLEKKLINMKEICPSKFCRNNVGQIITIDDKGIILEKNLYEEQYVNKIAPRIDIEKGYILENCNATIFEVNKPSVIHTRSINQPLRKERIIRGSYE